MSHELESAGLAEGNGVSIDVKLIKMLLIFVYFVFLEVFLKFLCALITENIYSTSLLKYKFILTFLTQ